MALVVFSRQHCKWASFLPPDRGQTNVVIYSRSTLGALPSKCRPSVWCAPGVSNDNSKVFASETEDSLHWSSVQKPQSSLGP